METMKIQVVKLMPDFYCKKQVGVCHRGYTCINPAEPLNHVCLHLVVKSPSRKLHEVVLEEKEAEG